MIVEEKNCKVETSNGAIACAYDHPLRRKKYAWDLLMNDDRLIYNKAGRSRRVYDVSSLEEVLFEVKPVTNNKMVKGYRGIAYVKIRGELGAIKLCHLMVEGRQADAAETEAYRVMDGIVKTLAERYTIPGTYSDSILTKDKLNKLIKGVIIVSGILLAFIVMALLAD
jgi:hypothetical protein